MTVTALCPARQEDPDGIGEPICCVLPDGHNGMHQAGGSRRVSREIGPVPKNWDPRCEGFNTKPGVIYHAHDLPRCTAPAVGVVDDHILCERHLLAWLETHPTGRTSGSGTKA